MAIKIKHKKSQSEEPEVESATSPEPPKPAQPAAPAMPAMSAEEYEAALAAQEAEADGSVKASDQPVLLNADGSPAPMGEDLDQFLASGKQSVDWATRHQATILVAVVGILLLAAGVVYFRQHQAEQRVEVSDKLTVALESLEARVGEEPAPLPDTIKRRKPPLMYKTAQEKYAALSTQADEVLKTYGDQPAAGSARLMKARAAFGLGKFDEAAGLYQEWLKANPSAPERPFVLQALATTQAAGGKTDEAVTTLQELKKLNPETYGELVSWQSGVFYEAAGQKDKAKAAYEELVKTFPEGAHASQAQMRLDLM